MRALWRLELLAYWLEGWPYKPDKGRWGPFLRLVAVMAALEVITFLWIASGGSFRPLSTT